MLVGGRGEELMQERRQRRWQLGLIGIALVLHVGTAVGFDLASRRLQHPRVACPAALSSSVGARVTLSGETAPAPGAEIRTVRWAVVHMPRGATYSFSAPGVNPTTFIGRSQGVYDVSLTAFDTLGRSSSCTVAISLNTEIDLEAPPPPPPPPPPIPEPQAPPPPEPPRVVEHREHEPPPPPAPAQAPPPRPTEAAPIMTVNDEFSNDQEVAASGHNVNATGDVASEGERRGPGQGVSGAQVGGTPNGTGHGPVRAAQAPAASDFTSRARFECDENSMRSEFPDAAAQAGITEMTVRVRVVVDAGGHITRVEALNDPGYGFAAAAMNVVRRHCDVTPARDRGGSAVGDTKDFAINFTLE